MCTYIKLTSLHGGVNYIHVEPILGLNEVEGGTMLVYDPSDSSHKNIIVKEDKEAILKMVELMREAMNN